MFSYKTQSLILQIYKMYLILFAIDNFHVIILLEFAESGS